MYKKIAAYLRMIRFSHTIFALPFALSALILAWRYYTIALTDIIWILFAMAGARSAAMGFNRIVDLKFDEKNPRTSMRALPSGTISKLSTIIFIIFFSVIFVFSAFRLSKLCFYLSFPVLGILFSYSYTKRFTFFSHLYLGFAISLAPVGTWIAVTGTFDRPILILSFALMTYIAGFDILYACQDADFDKKEQLFSIPAQFGIQNALYASVLLHILSFVSLFFIYILFDMNIIYLLTVFLIGVLLIIEHKLVTCDDLSKINIAFFNINSVISIILFAGILSDELFRRLM